MPVPVGVYLAGSALASLLGGILSRRRTQTQRSQTTTTPTFAPQFSPLLNPLIRLSMDRLRNRGGLPAGYETGGIQRINSTYDTIRGNLTNRLAAGGQSIAGAQSPAQQIVLGNLEGARGGSIADFQTSLPEVAREREMEDIMQALQVLGLGRGTSSTGSTTIPGETFGQGFGAGITDIAAILGLLSGQAGQGSRAGGPNPRLPVLPANHPLRRPGALFPQ